MVTIKQIIRLWGKNYQEVAEFLGFKSSSTIEKRMKNKNWKQHEIKAIVQEVETSTGIHIPMDIVQL